MLWDLAGNDSYESSNFSQGVGYFFGNGLKMDLSGNDTHTAARYGMGSSAHFGIGEFIEMAGDDVYDSTGPTYNAGCAWDQSLAIFLEGAGDDVYNLTRSAGPGRGDINSFGFAAELGGSDTYNLNGMPAGFSRGGVSAFFDLAGPDRFVIGGEAKEWVGETLEVNPEGSLTYLVPSED
jgi:hypothetical protein